MPLRNPQPVDCRPSGVTDAEDGSEAFSGAMSALTDLVPSLKTNHQWVARQAATQIGTVDGGGQFISCALVIGDILYGMISVTTGGLSGHDKPFAYNLSTAAQITVSGQLAANTPTSPSQSGAWTPPA